MASKKQTNGKDPAVLLYTQDFLVGTISMNFEERGKYITLLCMQHQKGKLTLKDLKSVLSDEDIDVAERFPLHADGFYYNDRMQMEIENRKIRTDSSRQNGAKGGRPPKTTILPNDEPNHNLTETHRLLIGKPKNNPSGTGTGNENVNENITVNVNEYKSSNKVIAYKTLDKLTEYIDDNNIPAAKELVKAVIEDYNGFENILQLCYGDDESVLKNWQQYYYNALQFLK